MIQIQDQFFDFWEVRSLAKHDEYNDTDECMDYGIILNKDAVSVNYRDVVFKYESEEERDQALLDFKRKCEHSDIVVIVGEEE